MYSELWASLVAQKVNSLPVVRETQVQSLGLGRSPGEENGNPLLYSCLEKSHGLRSLASYSLWGCRVGHNLATSFGWYSELWRC